MTRLQLGPYQPEHFVEIEVSAVEAANRVGMPVDEWAIYHGKNGTALTAFTPDGEVAFCFGVHHKWNGCGELWAVFSPIVKRLPVVVYHTGRLIDSLFRLGNYRRLQAVVDVRFEETYRFLLHFGFRNEGTLEAYGPHGEDRVMMALVRYDNGK